MFSEWSGRFGRWERSGRNSFQRRRGVALSLLPGRPRNRHGRTSFQQSHRRCFRWLYPSDCATSVHASSGAVSCGAEILAMVGGIVAGIDEERRHVLVRRTAEDNEHSECGSGAGDRLAASAAAFNRAIRCACLSSMGHASLAARKSTSDELQSPAPQIRHLSRQICGLPPVLFSTARGRRSNRACAVNRS